MKTGTFLGILWWVMFLSLVSLIYLGVRSNIKGVIVSSIFLIAITFLWIYNKMRQTTKERY